MTVAGADPRRPWRDVFVGREGELAAAREALEGSARVLVLHGPPGIGRTALWRRLARGWRESGGLAGFTRASDPERALVGLAEALARSGMERLHCTADRCGALLALGEPGMGGHFPLEMLPEALQPAFDAATYRPRPRDPQATLRARAGDLARDLAAAGRPALLALSLADGGEALERFLLDTLLPRLLPVPGVRVVLLASGGPGRASAEERWAPLWPATIELSRLEPPALARLLASIGADPADAEALHAHTAGVPLAVWWSGLSTAGVLEAEPEILATLPGTRGHGARCRLHPAMAAWLEGDERRRAPAAFRARHRSAHARAAERLHALEQTAPSARGSRAWWALRLERDYHGAVLGGESAAAALQQALAIAVSRGATYAVERLERMLGDPLLAEEVRARLQKRGALAAVEGLTDPEATALTLRAAAALADEDETRAALRAGVAARPGAEDLWTALAALEVRAGSLERAEAVLFEQLAVAGPAQRRVRTRIGWLRLLGGQVDDLPESGSAGDIGESGLRAAQLEQKQRWDEAAQAHALIAERYPAQRASALRNQLRLELRRGGLDAARALAAKLDTEAKDDVAAQLASYEAWIACDDLARAWGALAAAGEREPTLLVHEGAAFVTRLVAAGNTALATRALLARAGAGRGQEALLWCWLLKAAGHHAEATQALEWLTRRFPGEDIARLNLQPDESTEAPPGLWSGTTTLVGRAHLPSTLVTRLQAGDRMPDVAPAWLLAGAALAAGCREWAVRATILEPLAEDEQHAALEAAWTERLRTGGAAADELLRVTARLLVGDVAGAREALAGCAEPDDAALAERRRALLNAGQGSRKAAMDR